MSTTRHVAQRKLRTGAAGWSLRALMLTAIVLGAIASGCILDHDPRDDSSRGDADQRVVLANSMHVPV
jgi:hypothetical protein